MEVEGRRDAGTTGAGRRGNTWWRWVTVWSAVGLAIRVATVLGRSSRKPGGDASYYHSAANLLADGKGFIDPFLYGLHPPHHYVPSASFPPGFVLVLAAAAVVGFKGFFAQRIWCCILGAAAVPLCGYTGREIAGRRVGLIAAFLVAVYPNMWMNDELALSESLSPVVVALVLLTAYRYWRNPSFRRAAWMGGSIGVAALVRDELSLLGLLILVPLIVFTRQYAWRRRVACLAVGVAASVVVVGPWVGYNLTRFQDPVFISSGFGITLASANCADTFSGPNEGYWSWSCAINTPINHNVDESVQSAEAQTYAMTFIRAHENRLVPVELAKEGRAFGLFHPIQQIKLDTLFETRPYHWALLGLGMYYVLALLSIAGAVMLRRRRVPILPLIAIGITVVASVALTFGDTRYRATFEVSLVLLAAVAIEALWNRLARRNATGGAPTIAEAEDSDAAAEAVGGTRVSSGAGLPSGTI